MPALTAPDGGSTVTTPQEQAAERMRHYLQMAAEMLERAVGEEATASPDRAYDRRLNALRRDIEAEMHSLDDLRCEDAPNIELVGCLQAVQRGVFEATLQLTL